MAGRSLLIFGNGLGMALDAEFFRLSRAMATVWDDPDLIPEAHRTLIEACLRANGSEPPPQSEDHLDYLQRATAASDFLRQIPTPEGISWLTEHGHEFSNVVQTYLANVAWQFHEHRYELPREFLEPLIEFLQRTKTHIATTNYDNLLYQKLIEGQVLRGYDGALVDGLVNAGFRSDNLDRLPGRDFGFYLHLHGSPLFVDVNGAIVKQQQATAFPHPTPHLVLTHFEHKPFVIASSYLLSSYWWRFSQAIQEALADSGRITVFGYSGMDEHLNRELHGHADKIRVVEWHDGATDDEDRLEFWRDRLGGPIELVREENILNFQEWE